MAKVVLQADGKAIAVGHLSTGPAGSEANLPTFDIALARYNVDGTLDATFGSGGKVRLRRPSNSRGIDAVVQADGKIVVLGACGDAHSDSRYPSCIFRFDSTGALDPAFSGDLSTFGLSIAAIALQADGKIVGATSGSNAGFGVVRFTTSGALDASFGTQGVVSEPGSTLYNATSIAIALDGSLIVSGVGFPSDPYRARRFTSAGVYDSTYAPVISGAFAVYASVIEADGNLLIAGCAPSPSTGRPRLTVARLTASGALDAGFGPGGVAQPASLFDMCARSMVVRTDHTITIAAADSRDMTSTPDNPGPGGGATFHVVRFVWSGSLDPSFGSSGYHGFSVGSGFDIAYSLALQTDGKVVVGGDLNARDFALARLADDGSIDATFGTAGVTTTDIGAGRNGRLVELRVMNGRAVALANLPEPDVRVTAIGEIGLARFTAAGVPDAAFGSGGQLVSSLSTPAIVGPFGARVQALAVQPDDRVLVAGVGTVAGTQSAVIMRFNADGTIDGTFGNAGRAAVFTAPDANSGIQVVELLASGKILVAGKRTTPPLTGCCSSTYDLFLARLMPDGSLDASFGNAGVARFTSAASGPNRETRVGLAVLPNGAIIASGVDEDRLSAMRLLVDGALDTSYGTSGRFAPSQSHGTGAARSVSIQADGRIAIGGKSRFPTIAQCGNHTILDFIAFTRSNAAGIVDSATQGGGSLADSLGNLHPGLWSTRLGPDDRIVGAGFLNTGCSSVSSDGLSPDNRGRAMVSRFTSAGALDTSFGHGGMVELGNNIVSDNHARDVAVLTDGSIVAATENSHRGIPFTLYRLLGGGASAPAPLPGDIDGDGTSDANDSSPFMQGGSGTSTVTLQVNKVGPSGSVSITSAPSGIYCGGLCFFGFPTGTTVTLTATPDAGSVFTGWSGGGCSGARTCQVTLNASTTIGASSATLASTPTPRASASAVNFGGQSMQTTSPPQTVSAINGGTGTLTISSVSVSDPQFTQSNDCTALATGASCSIVVRFTPTVQGTVNGTLSVVTDAGTVMVSLTGVGERSLVTHYYQAILNRAPDATGKAYWDGEAARLASLGAEPTETTYVMAGYFFNSPEYASYNKTDAQFVTDLYNTFFNRGPDSDGLNYWLSQIQGGLPREVVLFSFMFSPEFRTFAQGIFGSAAARPEVNMVMDFFRGVLNRLPDTTAFYFWVGQFRTAQCQGSGAVYAKVNEVSYAFIFGTEYANRFRNNTQFVTDMYYAFLRRGGDTAGVQFWVNQLNTSAKDRNTVRADFIASPEFGARVNAVIAGGCIP